MLFNPLYIVVEIFKELIYAFKRVHILFVSIIFFNIKLRNANPGNFLGMSFISSLCFSNRAIHTI